MTIMRLVFACTFVCVHVLFPIYEQCTINGERENSSDDRTEIRICMCVCVRETVCLLVSVCSCFCVCAHVRERKKEGELFFMRLEVLTPRYFI